MRITNIDKILIILLIILYLSGYLIGGWNIFLNLVYFSFALSLIKKSYDNKKINTLYLIFFIIFIVLNLLIKIGYFLNLFQNQLIKQKKFTKESVPTPTIYQCPVINKKTEEDIAEENAEKTLSSYNFQEKYPIEQNVTVKIIEKILLPCEKYDENYCLLKNGNQWKIKYPSKWKLYRIKKQIFNDRSSENNNGYYYDLKFEDGSSYFYLKESIILSEQPIVNTQNQWNYLKKYCPHMFYSISINDFEHYICYGNILNYSLNAKGCFNEKYFINSYYKSFIKVNPKTQKETLIYDLYIPSIKFEKIENNKNIKELRVYDFSSNFYSDDEKFINELVRIYLSLYLQNNKEYLYKDNFTKEFINNIKNKPKEWDDAIKISAEKIASDVVRLFIVNSPKFFEGKISEKPEGYFDYVEYWGKSKNDQWFFIERFSGSQEGPISCEYWEKLKIGKGMGCTRLNNQEKPNYVDF
ncbi:MAG: hypothetical protein NZM02_02335 [Patescibacteria group bacterium]|nr:hypothetical protein [Patescibacteria group bacterium]